jgi:hypothetical protein
MVTRGRIRLLALCLVAACSAAPAAATELPGIRTPSGNIRCLFLSTEGRTLLCMIDRADYAARLQARCQGTSGAGLDWHGFTVGPTGPVLVNCSGGIQYDPATEHPRYVTLAYGRRWRAGPFTCASMRTGLTCRNARGHGLFLSRASWRAW